MFNKLLKKYANNEKGLTLIELLVVIVILGIIAAIAVVSIGGILDNSKKDAHVGNAQQLINATRLAVTSVENPSATYTIKALNEGGYLENTPTAPTGAGYGDEKSFVAVAKNATTGNYTFTVTLAQTDGKKYIDAKVKPTKTDVTLAP